MNKTPKNILMLDENTLLSFEAIEPIKHHIAQPAVKTIKRIRASEVTRTKPRKTDEWYIRKTLEQYEAAYTEIFKRAPFKNIFHRNTVIKQQKSKQNLLMIANYLLDMRDESFSWNKSIELFYDYFYCIFNSRKQFKRLPNIISSLPGYKNQEAHWKWIGEYEIWLGSSYLKSKKEWERIEAATKRTLQARPDDPWMDRCRLVAGVEPMYRKNRYLMLIDPITVLAEPLGAATTELVAFRKGVWLYRLTVDHTGNVIDQKEHER